MAKKVSPKVSTRGRGRTSAPQGGDPVPPPIAPPPPENVAPAPVQPSGGGVLAVPYIAEDLWPLAVPLATLQESPNNARRHSLERDIPVLMNSLRRFGQRKPIVAKRWHLGSPNVVLAGNGTLRAAERLEWTHIAVAWLPDTMSDEEAEAYALVDNRSAELSQWDLQELARQLQAVRARGGGEGVESLGWAAHEAGPLLDANWTPAAEGKLHPDQATRERSWRSMTFSVGQWAVVELAIQRAQERAGDASMPEGRAIELICADYLAGPTATQEVGS